MLTGIIIHLANDLPIMVDMDELPASDDHMLRCTNVRTLDGKRPPFVHDRHSTFILPIGMVRAIEVPHEPEAAALITDDESDMDSRALVATDPEPVEEEDEEDLLARIRQI